MAKKGNVFVCQSCGTNHNRWNGKCEGCGAWNTIVEELQMSVNVGIRKLDLPVVYTLSDADLSELNVVRYVSDFTEINNVCGGGIVPGSVILVGGDPGIGKSTLLLQLACNLSTKLNCLYLSGEESVAQIHLRASRMNLINSHLKLASTTSIEEVIALINAGPKPQLLIIDSIQTLTSDNFEAAAGSVAQVKACSHQLITMAKKLNISIILVGHVTKEGTLAGPRLLEHMVDTVLYFEGDRNHDCRILRAVKNRFGATNEIGIFAMQNNGLVEISNPSALFLADRQENISGSAVFAGMEGTRPMLSEIQALVSKSYLGMPRRTAVGFDQPRLSMILAVLESRAGFNFSNLDVYINVVGGLKINDPAADLAVAAALISAIRQIPNDPSSVFFGEIGLGGEIRNVAHAGARLKEAHKLGFKSAVGLINTNVEATEMQLKQLSLLKNFRIK